jgi:hypothetical protein
MAFRRPAHSLLRGHPRELAKIGPALGAAIDRFRRDVEKAKASQQAVRRRRVVPRPSRLPSFHVRRPAVHRAVHPHHVRPGAAPSVLQRQRSAQSASIEGGANRVAAGIRSGLLALRRGLSRLRPRLGGR